MASARLLGGGLTRSQRDGSTRGPYEADVTEGAYQLVVEAVRWFMNEVLRKQPATLVGKLVSGLCICGLNPTNCHGVL